MFIIIRVPSICVIVFIDTMILTFVAMRNVRTSGEKEIALGMSDEFQVKATEKLLFGGYAPKRVLFGGYAPKRVLFGGYAPKRVLFGGYAPKRVNTT